MDAKMLPCRYFLESAFKAYPQHGKSSHTLQHTFMVKLVVMGSCAACYYKHYKHMYW